MFLYVGTWDPRKRPDILVRNFSRAFAAKDNALLLIKSYATGDPRRDREILGRWISESIEGSAHVRFIPEVLSASEMSELFRFATAFVSASRGEGFCLPAVQAMSSGKPVLASGWSAFADYVTIPVEFNVEAVPKEVSLPGYSPDQRWAVIREDDLVRKLRWVHDHRHETRLLGQKARDWVLKNASAQVVGNRLRERIGSFCGTATSPVLEEALQ